MATPDLTAGQVMDMAAAALNDAAKSTYGYSTQLPYLNMALGELQVEFELNEVPVTKTVTSSPITVDAGEDHFEFNATPPTPELPDDLIEPKVLWVSNEGEDSYVGPIGRSNVLPRYMEGVDINTIQNFTWQDQQIRFFPATVNLDVKIDYIKNLFTEVTSEDDEIGVINAKNILAYRTAGLIAELVEENKERAAKLDGLYVIELGKVVGIGTKGRQATVTRRRPFRQNYRNRANI